MVSSDRAPLLGTAIRNMGVGSSGGLQVGVDVVERDALGEHEDLQMVEQLADLLGGLVVRLVLRGHPDLGRLLDDLLADRVDAGVELGNGARPVGPGRRLVGQLGIQLLKALHGRPAYVGVRPRPYGAHLVARSGPVPRTPPPTATVTSSGPVAARSATTVATAAVAASCPLSSAEPGSPARSSAWASSSQVSTPKPIGTRVRTVTSVMPTVAAWHT